MDACLNASKRLFKWEYWKFTLLFNIPLLPHYLSQVVLSSSDRIMIANMCTASDAGIYSIAYSAGMIMTLLTNSLNSTVVPWLYRALAAKELRRISKTSITVLGGLALIVLVVDILAPEVVAILAPGEYSEAMTLVPVIAASVFFMFMYSYCSNIEFYYEKTGLAAVASVLAAVLNVISQCGVYPLIWLSGCGLYNLGVLCGARRCSLHFLSKGRACRGWLLLLSTAPPCGVLALVFTAISLVLPLLYPHPIVRYAVFGIAVVAAVVFRKKIVTKVKEFKG